MLDYNFVVKKIMKLHLQHNSCICFHIDTTTLADGMYELVPENNEGGNLEAQVNRAIIIEDLNPSSVADLTNTAQEGKPRA